MHGCRPCEYDLCHDCFQARTFSPEKARADSSIALAAVDSLMSSMLTNAGSRGSRSANSPTKHNHSVHQNPSLYGSSSAFSSSSTSPGKRSPAVLQPSPGSVRIVANKGFVFNRGGDKTSHNSASSSSSNPRMSSSSPSYNPNSPNGSAGNENGNAHNRTSPTSSPNNNHTGGRASPNGQQLTPRGEALFGTLGSTYWSNSIDNDYQAQRSSAIPGVSSYYASPKSPTSPTMSGYNRAPSPASSPHAGNSGNNGSGYGVPPRQASLYPRVSWIHSRVPFG